MPRQRRETGPQPARGYAVPEPVGPMPDGDRAAYARWLAPSAIAMQRQLGIPASVAVAMSVYETAQGSSRFAQEGRNLFAIRGGGSGWGNPFWDGDVLLSLRDGSPWRRYPSFGTSLMDFGHLFYRVDRYAPALAHRGNPEQFLEEIVPVYAPRGDGNPTYLRDVLSIRADLDLGRLDVPPESWELSTALVPAAHIDTWLAALDERERGAA